MIENYKLLPILTLMFSLTSCASVTHTVDTDKSVGGFAFKYPESCLNNEALQTKRSQQLQEILKQDFKDRSKPFDQLNWTEISAHDLAHRKAIGEIIGEGCLRTPQDYMAAAVIFSHGDTPDHSYLAYMYSLNAMPVNRDYMSGVMAGAVDHYMTNKGYKQIFGLSTAFTGAEGCLCLYPVEESVPDALRVKYLKKNLQQLVENHRKKSKKTHCKETPTYCPANLKMPPKGYFKDIW